MYSSGEIPNCISEGALYNYPELFFATPPLYPRLYNPLIQNAGTTLFGQESKTASTPEYEVPVYIPKIATSQPDPSNWDSELGLDLELPCLPTTGTYQNVSTLIAPPATQTPTRCFPKIADPSTRSMKRRSASYRSIEHGVAKKPRQEQLSFLTQRKPKKVSKPHGKKPSAKRAVTSKIRSDIKGLTTVGSIDFPQESNESQDGPPPLRPLHSRKPKPTVKRKRKSGVKAASIKLKMIKVQKTPIGGKNCKPKTSISRKRKRVLKPQYNHWKTPAEKKDAYHSLIRAVRVRFSTDIWNKKQQTASALWKIIKECSNPKGLEVVLRHLTQHPTKDMNELPQAFVERLTVELAALHKLPGQNKQ